VRPQTDTQTHIRIYTDTVATPRVVIAVVWHRSCGRYDNAHTNNNGNNTKQNRTSKSRISDY